MPITVRTRQSELRENPWQMMVICQMLNQTSYKQVDRVSPVFFEKWPSPQALVKANRADIIEVIRPLGFYNRRADLLIDFSRGWLELEDPLTTPVETIAKLSGIGKYAIDSWRIFQLNDLNVEPTDKVLIEYLKAARQQHI
jgi:adenine-specific DNA glycosylase